MSDLSVRTALPNDKAVLYSTINKSQKIVSLSSLKAALAGTVVSNILFVSSSDSPFNVTQSGKIVSCDTDTSDITIYLPDNPVEGFTSQIVHYEGDYNVIVTTQGGTTEVGGSGVYSQTIRGIGDAITVVYQTSSGSPEYIIVQDSRNSLNNRITVTKPSDLSGTLDSTKEYFIDGVVDFTGSGVEIIVPPTGLTIRGYGFDVSQMICSDNNYTMFKYSGTANNGDLFLSDITFSVSGTNSKVFDVSNQTLLTNAIEMNTVNFTNCTAIGEIAYYRQSLMQNIGVFGCDDGFVFSGSWAGGVRVDAFIAPFFDGGTLFSAGTGLTFATRFFSNGNVNIQPGSVGYSFSPSNFTQDDGFQLQNGNFVGGGTYVTGITEASVKSKFRNNVGITDTYVGASWEITTETATTVSATSTLYQLNGTYTYSDLVHFSDNSVSGGTNDINYDSSLPLRADIIGVLDLTSGNNNQVKVYLRQWDDSASTYITIKTATITTNGAGRAENVTLLASVTLNLDDRLEVWVSNETAAQDITGLLGSNMIVSERQS